MNESVIKPVKASSLWQAIAPWIIWGLGALFFFLMYVARVSPGVMSTQLMFDFQVRALALGSLSVFFFYPYVILQIPVGMLMDRFGPRLLLTVMVAVCGVSCLVFAGAESIAAAALSRLLLGFGAAFSFVGALKLASVWFPPERIGLLAGLTQTLGMLGAAVGEHPIAYLVEANGWRATLGLLATLFFILSALIFLIVRNSPAGKKETIAATESGLLQGLGQVLSNPQTWINGIYAGLVYAPTAAFAELWGNSFFQAAYGFDLKTSAFAIGLIFIGWSVGAPLLGGISDRMGRRKPMMYLSVIASGILLTSIIYIPHIPTALLYLMLFCFGVVNTGVVVAYAVASEINPHKIAGTSLGVANMLSIIIGALFQPLVGLLLDLHANLKLGETEISYTANDFRSAMLVFLVCTALALLCALLIKETYCSPIDGERGL